MMNSYIKHFWKENLMIVFIILLASLCETFVSIQMANLLDALIVFDLKKLRFLFLLICLLFLLHFTFLRLRIIKISHVKQKMATAIRSDIARKIEKSSYKEFHHHPTATYASWLTNDINTIESLGFDNFYALLSGSITAIASIIALFYFHWSLALLAIFTGLLTIKLPQLLEKNMREATLTITKENENFMTIISEILAGFDTFFSYNLLSIIPNKTQISSIELGDKKKKQAKILATVTILSIFGSIFGQVSIVGLTALLALQKIVSIGAFSATGNLSISIFNLLGNVSNQLSQIKSIEPIFEKFNSFSTTGLESQSNLTPTFKDITLTNLSYSYGGKQVIDSLNYQFIIGNKYAIIGSSGSGKSTLLNIISGRLSDYSGSITFSGTELNHIQSNYIHDNIAYIEQTPFIMSGSIKDNITLGEDFSEADFLRAIVESDLSDMIKNLPNGSDTQIEEAGRSLSGGQKQRISLARGIIRGKNIILIDESTANLDNKSALSIEKNLMRHKNLTVILITHHLRKEIEVELDGILDFD